MGSEPGDRSAFPDRSAGPWFANLLQVKMNLVAFPVCKPPRLVIVD
jgi:hypothetical protein